MSFTRSELQEQAEADRAYFDKRGASVKNALVSELKKFWPVAAGVWPTKFLYAKDASAEAVDVPPDPNEA